MRHKKVLPAKQKQTLTAWQPPQRITVKSDGTVLEYQSREGDAYIYKYTNRLSATGRRCTKYGTSVPLRETDIKRLLYWQDQK